MRSCQRNFFQDCLYTHASPDSVENPLRVSALLHNHFVSAHVVFIWFRERPGRWRWKSPFFVWHFHLYKGRYREPLAGAGMMLYWCFLQVVKCCYKFSCHFTNRIRNSVKMSQPWQLGRLKENTYIGNKENVLVSMLRALLHYLELCLDPVHRDASRKKQYVNQILTLYSQCLGKVFIPLKRPHPFFLKKLKGRRCLSGALRVLVLTLNWILIWTLTVPLTFS